MGIQHIQQLTEQQHENLHSHQTETIKSDAVPLKKWLKDINLEIYYDLFIEQSIFEINVIFLKLNDEDLKDLGISKVMHRKLILHHIQRQIQINHNKQHGDDQEAEILIDGRTTTKLPQQPLFQNESESECQEQRVLNDRNLTVEG